MVWKGLAQLRESGLVGRSRCRLLGVQLEGPLQETGRRDARRGHPFTELEESEPFFKKEANRAIRDSGGTSLATNSAETIRATALLARTEGIFAEPASASVVAAMRTARERGIVSRDDNVVCVITGAGLKDTKAISRLARTARRVPVREEYSVARMQIGETKTAMLRLLGRKPTYGYQLWQSLALQRRITTASVYQHLSELEEMSLVRRTGVVTYCGRERVQYGLTRSGTDFLRMAGAVELVSRWEPARGPGQPRSPVRSSRESTM
jgi:DNA-binding PadR family transcriptional regulator